ncbi:hypothetical protein H4R18_004422 [Coemansia javaensis]|uniref:Probable RNA polymerase II nuclear localization protein SLC7A6OS n=1 Tax=Coemansia javaensis TaxID=2761396 RepID=A0A9W8H5Q6_9FUNG|nr:hypothetical protein H4R18_004422 [Coemansia javaensis]
MLLFRDSSGSPAAGMPPGGEITVLRIKRKRDQEPLDALVLHRQQTRQRRKFLRSRPSSDSLAATPDAREPLLFALGESITEADFGDAAKRRALQSRLAALAADNSNNNNNNDDDDAMDVEDAPRPQPPPPPPPPPSGSAASAQRQHATLRVVGRREMLAPDDDDDGDDDRTPPASSAAATSSPLLPGPPRSRIPQVIAATELRRQQQQQQQQRQQQQQQQQQQRQRQRDEQRVRMYDAIREDAPAPAPAARGGFVAQANPQTADELVPMVREYLSVGVPAPEYVYDFYYIPHAQAAMGALHAANIGSVLWLGDPDDAIPDSDCDQGDEDDDSNAEDFYRNDYPDDEPDSASGADEYYYSDEDRSDHSRPDPDGLYDEW